MADSRQAASPKPAGIIVGKDGVARCWWCGDDPLYRRYHDLEWGRPVDDDRRLFEKLCLEGFQAGLSWLTILRKRESFRRAFEDFQIEAVARFDTSSVDRLLADAGIVRNRTKIEATINNARLCIELIDELGSLAAYVWRFEPDARSRPTVLDQPTLLQIGASAESKAMSKDLRRRGWSFVGPTTVYSFMGGDGAGQRPPRRMRCPRGGGTATPHLPSTVRRAGQEPSAGVQGSVVHSWW